MSDTASNTPGPAAEDAQDTASAIAAAVRQMEIEVWTLYAIGVCVTILRTYARLKSVGIRNFRADDFLVWGERRRRWETSGQFASGSSFIANPPVRWRREPPTLAHDERSRVANPETAH